MQVQEGSITDKRVQDISYGPRTTARVYPGFIVNGYRFHTKDYGQNKSTMNSGICVKGSTYIGNELDYYGILEEVLELQYLGHDNHIVIFKCHWFDPHFVQNDTTYKIVDVKHKSKLRTYEPFILAAQAQQVYYSNYPSPRMKDWWAVCKVKTRILPNYESESSEVPDENTSNTFFQADQTDVGPLGTHFSLDETDESLWLYKENEVEEVDPSDLNENVQGEGESSEEEECTADEDEEDDEDEAELDIDI